MDEQRFDSQASGVTFFEDRARVTRTARIVVTGGRQTLSLRGITVLIDDSSLVVRSKSDDVRVLTSRVHRTVRSIAAASDEEIDRLESDRQQSWRALELLRRDLARCGTQRKRLVSLEQAMLHALQQVPRGEGGDDAAWREALDDLSKQFDGLDDENGGVVETVAAARRAEARAALLLDQARVLKPQVEAEIELEIDAPNAGEAHIEFEYFTPCALWRPSHIARLSKRRESINLRMLATVWQYTGEVWDDVVCRFSTARPTQAAEAPIITDDWLRARPKTDEEKNVVQVEARDVDIASTGSEVSGHVDQMPGVDDGGEPLTLTATERVSIPSNGEPFRVEMLSVDVKCACELVGYPEKSSVPFLRATGTWTHDVPVLAGPVVVMRGNEYAGRSRIDFVSSGETFELGFGVDTGISIHRTIDDEHKTTAVTGKNVLHRTVKVFLSNLSASPRHLTVVERVPVSEIEEVSVKKVDAQVAPDSDGFVEFGVELAPRAVQTHEISYRVEYGSKVRLSW